MGRRTDDMALRDMREYAMAAVETPENASVDALQNDRTGDSALRYQVMTVGEAANRVSTEFRAQHPEIPWRQVVGMRNQLAHGYGEVVQERLHVTVSVQIPRLIQPLNAVLGEE